MNREVAFEIQPLRAAVDAGYRSRVVLHLYSFEAESGEQVRREESIIWIVHFTFRRNRKNREEKNVRFKNRITASTSRNNLLYVSGQRHGSDSICSQRAVISRPQIYRSSRFRLLPTFQKPNFAYIYWIERRRLLDSQKENKLIGHRAHLQEDDNLPQARAKPCKGLFTRYDFVACDKLTTGLRHDLGVVSKL